MNENLKLQYKLSLNYNEVYSEWWWTTIESLNIISSLLLSSNYVIIDNFLLRNEIEILYNEVISISISLSFFYSFFYSFFLFTYYYFDSF